MNLAVRRRLKFCKRELHISYDLSKICLAPSFYYSLYISVFSAFSENQFLKIRPLKKVYGFYAFFLLFSRIEFPSHDEMILIDVFLSLLTNKRSKITSVSPKNELQPINTFSPISSFLLVYNIRDGKSRTKSIDHSKI